MILFWKYRGLHYSSKKHNKHAILNVVKQRPPKFDGQLINLMSLSSNTELSINKLWITQAVAYPTRLHICTGISFTADRFCHNVTHMPCNLQSSGIMLSL